MNREQIAELLAQKMYGRPLDVLSPVERRQILATADAIMALDGWQTIDSAPRGGRVVDLWLRSYFWTADGDKQLAVELRAASCQWYGDQWCNEDGNPHETLQVFPEAEITHWRPLPQPPGDAG